MYSTKEAIARILQFELTNGSYQEGVICLTLDTARQGKINSLSIWTLPTEKSYRIQLLKLVYDYPRCLLIVHFNGYFDLDLDLAFTRRYSGKSQTSRSYILDCAMELNLDLGHSIQLYPCNRGVGI